MRISFLRRGSRDLPLAADHFLEDFVQAHVFDFQVRDTIIRADEFNAGRGEMVEGHEPLAAIDLLVDDSRRETAWGGFVFQHLAMKIHSEPSTRESLAPAPIGGSTFFATSNIERSARRLSALASLIVTIVATVGLASCVGLTSAGTSGGPGRARERFP